MDESRKEVEFTLIKKVSNILDSVHILIAAHTRKVVAEAILAEKLVQKQQGGVN